MCRLAAYLGRPILLEDVIAKPPHSLVQQSLRAEHAHTVTNGDGFGIGWYGEREEPAVYREVLPAWSDENLLSLTATVRSGLFFAHVRAATTGGTARSNCHPFRHGPHMFMHNGQIGGYPLVRRQLESLLPDSLFMQRRGATDSELMFLLILSRLHRGCSVEEAVHWTLDTTLRAMRDREVDAPLRFTAALSDGQRMHMFRLASDGQPPTLFVREQRDGMVVASEPLDDDPAGWTAVPAGATLRIDAQGVEQLEALTH